jgi:hypothetical protein
MQHQPMVFAHMLFILLVSLSFALQQVDVLDASVQQELQQAMVSLRRQSSSSGSASSASSQNEPKTPIRTVPTVPKLLDTHAHVHVSSNNMAVAAANAVAAAAAQNHVRLPNIQTLTQCLPKYPQVKMEPTPSQAAALAESLLAVSGPLNAAVGAKSDTSTLSSSSSNSSQPLLTSPVATATSSSMPMSFPVDPLASVKVEVQQQLDAEGNLVHKKKFQCMFCGIFLSTKCYLKNHINAMHTRARVYPCELCERYFYSAGALRIHKLRNHWQGSKKHKCGHCSETFLLPIELRKHILKKHLGSPEAMLMEGTNPSSLNALMMKASGDQPHIPSSEAAMAAATLAMAGSLAEPLSLVTSPVQAGPQNLSRGTPVSSDSPASLDDSQLSGSHASTPAMDTHADLMLSTTVVQAGNLGNGRGRHDVISPANDAMHE